MGYVLANLQTNAFGYAWGLGGVLRVQGYGTMNIFL